MKQIIKYLDSHLDEVITYDSICKIFDMEQFDGKIIIEILTKMVEHNNMVITRKNAKNVNHSQQQLSSNNSSVKRLNNVTSAEITFPNIITTTANLILESDDIDSILCMFIKEKDATILFRLLILYLISEKNSLLDLASDPEAQALINKIQNMIIAIQDYIFQSKVNYVNISSDERGKQIVCLHDMLDNNIIIEELKLLPSAVYSQIQQLLNKLVNQKANDITIITIPNCEYQIRKISSVDIQVYYWIDGNKIILLAITDSKSPELLKELHIRARSYNQQKNKYNLRSAGEDVANMMNILDSARKLEIQ